MEDRFPMLRMRLQSGLPSGPGGLKKERECMQSAKEKRQKQLEALEYVERFRGTIWDATMQVLHDPYLAEDAFQETALRFLRYYHSVDTSMDVFVKYYLKEIARNAALTVYKRHHKIDLYWEDVPPDLPDNAPSLENVVVNREAVRITQELIGQLGEKYSTPLILFVRGMRYKEIAEALGISVNTVRERIAYGRSKLNALYERVYGEEGWK